MGYAMKVMEQSGAEAVKNDTSRNGSRKKRLSPGCATPPDDRLVRSAAIAIQAITMGVQANLLKPFDAAQLKEVVERWSGKGI